MLKFTICFIKKAEQILLLNRESPSWMGMWNGVGGKIEPSETARESVLREVKEETGLNLDIIYFKGIVTWFVNGEFVGGMYIYFAELPESFQYVTPVKMEEGILDWKDIKWIKHPENNGVADIIPKSIERIVTDQRCFEYRRHYQDNQLIQDTYFEIDNDVENITDKNFFEERILSR